MQIRHNKNSNAVLLSDLNGGDVVLFQDTIWLVTQDHDESGTTLVDVSDGWTEIVKDDTMVYRLDATLDLGDNLEDSSTTLDTSSKTDPYSFVEAEPFVPSDDLKNKIRVELSKSKKKKNKKDKKDKKDLYNTI